MTDRNPSTAASNAGPLRARLGSRARRLLGPTLGVFGFDSDGRRVPPPDETEKGVEARVREADEKDDRARLAIAEAEIATERREKQQETESRPAPHNG